MFKSYWLGRGTLNNGKSDLVWVSPSWELCTFFSNFSKTLSEEIEFIPIDYAGHGKRIREKFYSSIDEAAEDMIRRMKSYITENDYAILGYSFGSVVVVQVIEKILQNINMKKPINVFICAKSPINTIGRPEYEKKLFLNMLKKE